MYGSLKEQVNKESNAKEETNIRIERILQKRRHSGFFFFTMPFAHHGVMRIGIKNGVLSTPLTTYTRFRFRFGDTLGTNHKS